MKVYLLGARTPVKAKRTVLAEIEGGCQAPIGGHATVDSGAREILKEAYSS